MRHRVVGGGHQQQRPLVFWHPIQLRTHEPFEQSRVIAFDVSEKLLVSEQFRRGVSFVGLVHHQLLIKVVQLPLRRNQHTRNDEGKTSDDEWPTRIEAKQRQP